MKSGYGKVKGKKYEDKIAADLHASLIILNEDYRDLYETVGNEKLKPRRDASSGNYVDSHGDIDLNLGKKFYPFSIECKHWADLDLSINSILSGKIKVLENFWYKQAVPKSLETGLHPLVVFKGNYTKDFVFYNHNRLPILGYENFIRIGPWVICLFRDFNIEVSNLIISKKPPFDE